MALREALINAVVHTDYSLGGTIKVTVFEDRIEIENSALLLLGLTLEDLKKGVSKLRNPVIARVFNELGLIEQWGKWYPKNDESLFGSRIQTSLF